MNNTWGYVRVQCWFLLNVVCVGAEIHVVNVLEEYANQAVLLVPHNGNVQKGNDQKF